MNHSFKIYNVDELSRAGEIVINGIKIQTPCFMPVATQASVKSLDSFELSDIGFKLILSNSNCDFICSFIKIIIKYKY